MQCPANSSCSATLITYNFTNTKLVLSLKHFCIICKSNSITSCIHYSHCAVTVYNAHHAQVNTDRQDRLAVLGYSSADTGLFFGLCN